MLLLPTGLDLIIPSDLVNTSSLYTLITSWTSPLSLCQCGSCNFFLNMIIGLISISPTRAEAPWWRELVLLSFISAAPSRVSGMQLVPSVKGWMFAFQYVFFFEIFSGVHLHRMSLWTSGSEPQNKKCKNQGTGQLALLKQGRVNEDLPGQLFWQFRSCWLKQSPRDD